MDEKYRQYQRVFDYFDENGDGKVSAAELQQRMGGAVRLEEEETEGWGEEGVSFEEFVRIVEEGSEEEKDRELKEAFRMYEMEGRGGITAESLQRMLEKLGEERSIRECKNMIACYDLNGDGLLCFDEFKASFLVWEVRKSTELVGLEPSLQCMLRIFPLAHLAIVVSLGD
nr:putative calcium-binding protein CML19 [Ipomoea batatas]